MEIETSEKSGEKQRGNDGPGGHGENRHVKVTLVWGGTGESKPETVKVSETAGQVFNDVYERFHQKPSDQDTFELNEKSFLRSDFGLTVEHLLHTVGPDLTFEVIPPTSGA